MGKLWNRFVRYVAFKRNADGLQQEMNQAEIGQPIKVPEIVEVARKAAADGIVLLKNNHQTLPLTKDDKVAVFGRCQNDYFTVGYGSGGDVISPYRTSLMQGMEEEKVNFDKPLAEKYAAWSKNPKNIPDEGYWGHWPMSFPEMPISEKAVQEASKRCNKALIVIGRAAGESRENILKKGSYYLTDQELKLLKTVTDHFKHVAVILDCGNIIDMGWTMALNQKLDSIVYAWQGGMEAGRALTDVLTGKVNPSAKLTDTIAKSYEDYPSAATFGGKTFNNYEEDIYVGYRYFETFHPDRVLYPFGFGLSYTTFTIKETCSKQDGDKIRVRVAVANTGDKEGREVVQVYVRQVGGKMDRPVKVLAGFDKTAMIQPGESEVACIDIDLADIASYDDTGVTGYKNCKVLEAGEYHIEVGTSIRDTKEVCCITLEETKVVEKLQEVMAVREENAFKRLKNDHGTAAYEMVPTATRDLRKDILAELPAELTQTRDDIDFSEVLEGKASAEEFVAQLTLEELDDITHGTGKMSDPDGPQGNAGGFGGVTELLKKRGMRAMITTDGPSGIRVKKVCSLLPCGTALASAFDPEMTEKLYSIIGKEMKIHGSDMLLAPGMNIHRDPLCGRNFEYFSEDPMVAGINASAVVKGIQSQGVSACPKHFACNNQEMNRNTHDSRVSERAMREIYLKGFELVVKNAKPMSIMTSYNKINGVWSHYNYELVTTVLRQEWGYEGLVITDWWMQMSPSREFPNIEDDAYRVRAQVDVLMPGECKTRTLVPSMKDPEGVTKAEAQRCALNVINFMVKVIKNIGR